MEADCKENLALSSKFCAQKPKVHASLLIPASVACSCGPSCVCTHYSVQLLALAIHCTLQSICCLVQLCTCLRRTHLAHTSCARVWCTCLAHIVYTQCTHLAHTLMSAVCGSLLVRPCFPSYPEGNAEAHVNLFNSAACCAKRASQKV